MTEDQLIKFILKKDEQAICKITKASKKKNLYIAIGEREAYNKLLKKIIKNE